MSERYDVRIRFGGRLKKICIGPLLEEIANEGLDTEWGIINDLSGLRKHLLAAAEENRPVEYMTHESNGMLDKMKDLLQNIGLSYQVELSGNDQYAPTTTVWRPGTIEGYFLTSDNKPVILLELIQAANTEAELKKLIGEITELAEPLPSLQLVD